MVKTILFPTTSKYHYSRWFHPRNHLSICVKTQWQHHGTTAHQPLSAVAKPRQGSTWGLVRTYGFSIRELPRISIKTTMYSFCDHVIYKTYVCNVWHDFRCVDDERFDSQEFSHWSNAIINHHYPIVSYIYGICWAFIPHISHHWAIKNTPFSHLIVLFLVDSCPSCGWS